MKHVTRIGSKIHDAKSLRCKCTGPNAYHMYERKKLLRLLPLGISHMLKENAASAFTPYLEEPTGYTRSTKPGTKTFKPSIS